MRIHIAALLLAALPVVAFAQTKFVPLDIAARFTAGPLSDPQPPSTLLPAGATTVDLIVRAARPTRCRYSVGKDLPFAEMTPFDTATASTEPKTTLRNLNPDPRKVNDIYIRCDADPNAVLHLQYRSLPAAKPGFPRTANLWGSWNLVPKGMEYASRVDLWLGAHFSADQIRKLRDLNPNCYILNSINTVENNDVPDDYFLRDVNGKKIEVWPGAYRLNLTRPEVADYQARYAYQKMLESGLRYDGCFFDNFMMSQSWQRKDIYDNPVQVDADSDGQPDKPEDLDKAWRAGVFRELQTWRKYMPHALTTGHSQGYPHPDVAEIFNGQGIGFMTTDVIEGKASFAYLWDYYHAWCDRTVKPAITSVESAVPDQIAYGYDFEPKKKTPASTWAFARDYYPYMRFGLAFTLMNDGYFSHELGDTDHGQDWWYDELDFKLGAPLGPAVQISPAGQPVNPTPIPLLDNPDFSRDLQGSWYLWCDTAASCAATVRREPTGGKSGTPAARITITSAGRSGGIEFAQNHRKLEKGKSYQITFNARSSVPTDMTLFSSKNAPNWDNYGLQRTLHLTREWQTFTTTFTATQAASDARFQFIFSATPGDVWIDAITVVEGRPDLYRRDFQNGIVLLNGTHSRQAIDVGPGFKHLTGQQAPRHQYLLDDTAPAFSTQGSWQDTPLGTKEWHAIPPYYHAWKDRCHISTDAAASATWDLQLRAPGSYTIQAWWAAAPDAATWTKQAVYEVLVRGQVIASKTLDQTRDGDQWHTLVEDLRLDPADQPTLRLRNAGPGTLVADALHVFPAERLNDGQPVRQVTLEPMDGLILQRSGQP